MLQQPGFLLRGVLMLLQLRLLMCGGSGGEKLLGKDDQKETKAWQMVQQLNRPSRQRCYQERRVVCCSKGSGGTGGIFWPEANKVS